MIVFHAAFNHLFVRDWSAAAAGFTQRAGALSGACRRQQDQPCLPGSVSGRQSFCGQNHPAKHSGPPCFRGPCRFGALGLGHAGTRLCHCRKDCDRFSLELSFWIPEIPRKHSTRAVPPSPAATWNRPSVILPRRCPFSKGLMREDPRRAGAPCRPRITLRLYGAEGGCHPRRSPGG